MRFPRGGAHTILLARGSQNPALIPRRRAVHILQAFLPCGAHLFIHPGARIGPQGHALGLGGLCQAALTQGRQRAAGSQLQNAPHAGVISALIIALCAPGPQERGRPCVPGQHAPVGPGGTHHGAKKRRRARRAHPAGVQTRLQRAQAAAALAAALTHGAACQRTGGDAGGTQPVTHAAIHTAFTGKQAQITHRRAALAVASAARPVRRAHRPRLTATHPAKNVTIRARALMVGVTSVTLITRRCCRATVTGPHACSFTGPRAGAPAVSGVLTQGPLGPGIWCVHGRAWRPGSGGCRCAGTGAA